MEHKFLVHKPEDSVGIAITDINAREKVMGIVQNNHHSTIEIESVKAIPLGHKIAIKPIAQNEKVIIYGWSCGYAFQPIVQGDHVHVHNIRSVRWK